MVNEVRLIDANALMTKVEKCTASKSVKALTFIMVQDAPTVDAVPVDEMREFAKGVVYQFGTFCQRGGRLHITTRGLTTMEWAFDILGWDDPHPVPDFECEFDGCHEYASCGVKTSDGYKRICTRHFIERREGE